MTGELDLKKLLAGMSPELRPETYVFATTSDRSRFEGISALMTFEESEGMTAIVLQSEAERKGIDFVFPSRHIILNIHSALEAVGLTAAVSAALTKADIPANIVAAYYHDHIFVPEDQAERAMKVLNGLGASIK